VTAADGGPDVLALPDTLPAVEDIGTIVVSATPPAAIPPALLEAAIRVGYLFNVPECWSPADRRAMLIRAGMEKADLDSVLLQRPSNLVLTVPAGVCKEPRGWPLLLVPLVDVPCECAGGDGECWAIKWEMVECEVGP